MDLGDVFEGADVWPPEIAPPEAFIDVEAWDPEPAAARAATRLGAPLRVGRSAVVTALASRLWTVLLLPVVRTGRLIDLTELVVADADGSVQLGLRAVRLADEATPESVPAALHDVLTPVIDRSRLAPGLQWGNVASSLVAAPRVYGDERLVPWVRELLAREPLAGRLEVRGGRVRRRSCCLFYAAPGAGLCGDCCFDTAPAPT